MWPGVTLTVVTYPPGPANPGYSPNQDPSGGWHQPGYYAVPQNPPPPPKRGMSNAMILLLIFGSLGALLIVGGIGAALSPDEKADSSPGIGAPAPYDAAEGQPAAGTPSTATSTETSTPPPRAAGPLTSFADGTHEVGSGSGQIPPGTYTAVVPDAMFDLCFWSRLRGFSGEGKDIIAIGSGNAGDKQRVTIATSDKGFETKGCGTWTKA